MKKLAFAVCSMFVLASLSFAADNMARPAQKSGEPKAQAVKTSNAPATPVAVDTSTPAAQAVEKSTSPAVSAEEKKAPAAAPKAQTNKQDKKVK